jgi:hypothetical protein
MAKMGMSEGMEKGLVIGLLFGPAAINANAIQGLKKAGYFAAASELPEGQKEYGLTEAGKEAARALLAKRAAAAGMKMEAA